jgi:hypothetical protein
MLNITAAPAPICAHCGREIKDLFCLPCALGRLDDTTILAHAKDIRLMSRKPIGKTCAPTDCAICGQPIPTGAMASLLAKHTAAHMDCMRELRARLDELLPQQEVVPTAELPFEDAFLEVL